MENILDEIPDEELRGDRVTLRLLHEDDADALFAIIDNSRAFLSRHLPWPEQCQDADDVASRIESWEIQAQMANGACWGIFEDQHLAGVIILGWIQAQHRSATVSYWLGESFTERGLATDALRVLSQFAFGKLGLNRLEISASVGNPASIAVATRAGFVQEGICREYEFINGNFEDHMRLSLLACDPR